jgi:hypothetical protein
MVSMLPVLFLPQKNTKTQNSLALQGPMDAKNPVVEALVSYRTMIKKGLV